MPQRKGTHDITWEGWTHSPATWGADDLRTAQWEEERAEQNRVKSLTEGWER